MIDIERLRADATRATCNDDKVGCGTHCAMALEGRPDACLYMAVAGTTIGAVLEAVIAAMNAHGTVVDEEIYGFDRAIRFIEQAAAAARGE